ncbi:hypothetical protein GA0115255_104263 [Streptomyces sp. Ncost-T6T-2b]|nr:hypothetical protein GA0115255_104263 [Streptomyces sp. Ncost-T6T-2b]
MVWSLPGAPGRGWGLGSGAGPPLRCDPPPDRRFFFSARIVYRQPMIGAAVISSASVAQVTIAGWLCPRKKEEIIEAPKTTMKNRWMRKVPKRVSGLDESPLGVTTNELLRRSTASISERA